MLIDSRYKWKLVDVIDSHISKNNVRLEMVGGYKYLGVVIDTFLEFPSHTNKLCATVAKKRSDLWVECVNIYHFLTGYSCTIL